MSDVRIYVEQNKILDFITLTEKSVTHKLKSVLRFKNGDKVKIFDGKGKEYVYRIENLDKKTIALKKERISVDNKVPKRGMVLGFPVMRESKIDFILQKGTELGVSKFIPFICQRSLKVKDLDKKDIRWQKIVLEAVRQSDRVWIPQVNKVMDFSQILALKYENKIAGSITSTLKLNKLNKKDKDIFFIVGPEGDFSQREYSQLAKNKFDLITLSKNILRTETAAIFGCGLLSYYFDLE